MRHRRCSVVLAASVVVFGCAALVRATPVTVPNQSFESPDIPDGSGSSVVDNWTYNLVLPSAGVNLEDYNDVSYSGTTANVSPLPGTATGDQAAFIFVANGNATINLSSAASLGPITGNTHYVLRVALGVARPQPIPTTIKLLANGSVVASNAISDASIPSRTFGDFTTSFDTLAVGDPHLGQALTIQVSATGLGGSPILGYGVDVDNVRLDATTVVPEPASAALASAGGLLLRRRTGKRRICA